jgi:hypothetical protein
LLPVSGIALAVREPAGADELYVIETTAPPPRALLYLASQVATTATGEPVDWAGLPATDLDATALIIRRSWLGDTIGAETRCPDPDCAERIDVSFSIAAYLDHHRPHRPRGVTEAAESGWFRLASTSAKGTSVRFRIPTIADLLAVQSAGLPPADTLTGRCVDAPQLTRPVARRLDRALSALAPRLNDLLGGACPGCGQEVALRFDPVSFAMADLSNAFAGLYAEVHALAGAYGWPEAAILALPRRRRQRYASLIAAQNPAQIPAQGATA